MEELKNFQESLKEMTEGEMDLISDLSRIQLTIRDTIKSDSAATEVIKMFAFKHPEKLRMRLENLKRDHKLKKITDEFFNSKASEILVSLRKLGAKLDDEESDMIDKNKKLKELFDKASDSISSDVESDVLKVAKGSIKNSSSAR